MALSADLKFSFSADSSSHGSPGERLGRKGWQKDSTCARARQVQHMLGSALEHKLEGAASLPRQDLASVSPLPMPLALAVQQSVSYG